MTNLVFSHNDIMYVVEFSVCLSTDMYQQIKLELFDCVSLFFMERRKPVSPKMFSIPSLLGAKGSGG